MKAIKLYLNTQKEVSYSMMIQELQSEEPNMALVEYHLRRANVLAQMVIDIDKANKA